MLAVHAFVAEVTADFIDAFETADNQSLQIQLRGDTHVHRAVQRVVVRHERARRRTAGQRLHHRRFDFHETTAVQILADFGDDLAAQFKRLADIHVADQIQIALTVALLHVRQTMPFFGQRTEAFRQEFEFLRADGRLACTRHEDFAFR